MSAEGAPPSGDARRRRTSLLPWLVALAGAAMGAGLAIGTNVSGVVLAGYGLVLALLGATAVVAARRAALRARESSRAQPPDPRPETQRRRL